MGLIKVAFRIGEKLFLIKKVLACAKTVFKICDILRTGIVGR